MNHVDEIHRHEQARHPDPRRPRAGGLPAVFRRAIPLDRLPPREREIAHILCVRGEATAAEICDALGAGVGNAAARSMLRRLEAKGVVQRRKQGRKYLYMPRRGSADAQLEALHALIDTHFNQSPMEAALMLLGMLPAHMPGQTEAIAKLSGLLKLVDLD